MMQWARLMLLLLAIVLGQQAAAAAEIVSYAIVKDDATLRVQGKNIRLYGVYVVDNRPFCDPRSGRRAARRAPPWRWTSKIQGFVRCIPQARHRDRSISAFCYVDGNGMFDPPVDLGAYLIREGWAVALPQAPFAYHTYQEIAKVNRRGVWGFQADQIIR